MMSDYSYFEPSEGELEDYEYPDEPDDDDETPTMPCPACGAEIYDDAERCPICGTYITSPSANSFWVGRSTWWIVLGILGTVATIVALAVGW